MDVEINRQGARALDEIQTPRLGIDDLRRLLENQAVVLDVRSPSEYGPGHIPGSFNIGLKGQYASWGGQILSPDEQIIVVANDETTAIEGVIRLARVGLENTAGWIAIDDWKDADQPQAIVDQWTVEDLERKLDDTDLFVLDVRAPNEYTSGHVPGAVNLPLGQLQRRIEEIEAKHSIAVICGSGYRSSIAASILERHGFSGSINVRGGTVAWIKAGFETAA